MVLLPIKFLFNYIDYSLKELKLGSGPISTILFFEKRVFWMCFLITRNKVFISNILLKKNDKRFLPFACRK